MYVKQHASAGESSSKTLFIINTPVHASIQTKIILQSLFERYGDVEKILVAPKPRKTVEDEGDASVEDLTLAMFEKEIRSVGGTSCGMGLVEETWYDQGRYAHVIFATPKDMKKFMVNFTKKKKVSDSVITFGKLEIQELQDISQQLYLKEKKSILQGPADSDVESDDDDSDDGFANEEPARPTGFAALVQAHKDKIPSRAAIKNICEQIMTKYEEAEEDAVRKQQASMSLPDAEGFVTVSYNAAVGDAVELEQNGTLGSTGVGGGRRKRERSRSTKNNLVKGSDELQDFYRFQMKESKKRHMQNLKDRFQDDLKRVKQMKDEKMYRPF